MRKLSFYLVSIFLIALFSTSIHAGQSELCEPLKADGVTKGLYGLCVAYHASGAGNQVVLDNYNRKKTPSDPVMPGTEPEEETLLCRCWNTLTAEDIGTTEGLAPSACVLSTDADLISYDNFDDPENTLSEFLFVSAGYCSYSNSVTGANDPPIEDLTDEEEDQCRVEVLGLAERDFEGLEFDCFDE